MKYGLHCCLCFAAQGMTGRMDVCRDEIAKKLDVGRVVFLFVVVFDFVGLFLAMIMRGMVDNHSYRCVEAGCPAADCLLTQS